VPGLFLIMLLVLRAGRWIGMRNRDAEVLSTNPNRILIESAIYGLLGLLLAFTIAGAANRFESRRLLTIQEANAIGTAYLRLDLLPAAAQPDLREKFRNYIDARLAVFRRMPDIEGSNAEAARAVQLQREIWSGAIAALPQSPPVVTAVLMPALNEMFDISASRAIAAKTHTPIVILFVLALLSLFCCLLAGYGLADDKPFDASLHMIGFALVVTISILVILDLDYPRVGFIRLDYADQALMDVRANMK